MGKRTWQSALLLLLALCISTCGSPGESPREPAFSLRASAFPIKWRVTRVDPQFHISVEDARRAVAKAISAWEEAAGRRLFKYDDNEGMTIQLVFDQRQKFLNDEASAKSQVTRAENELTQSEARQRQASKEFAALKGELQKESASFNDALRAYNAQVDRWNNQGGAPPEVVQQLDSEKEKIDRYKQYLVQRQRILETARDDANRLVRLYNDQATAYNQLVHLFNQVYGKSRTETIGEYTKTGSDAAISIYAFKDSEHLAIVLAHELGHAIGLQHVPGDDSIMSAVEKGKSFPTKLVLSRADVLALKTALR